MKKLFFNMGWLKSTESDTHQTLEESNSYAILIFQLVSGRTKNGSFNLFIVYKSIKFDVSEYF